MQHSSSHNEQDLLVSVSTGDEQAFAELIDRYSDLLGTHIFKLTRSKEITQEIVQDVFLKIWMTRESLVQVRNFKAWLLVISKNHALNAIRSVIREREMRKQLEKTYNGYLTDTDNELKKEQLGLLDKAISNLPPQQKTVWLLSRREGMKHSSIAEKMNLSRESVKKYIMIANESIKNYLKGYLPKLVTLLVAARFFM